MENEMEKKESDKVNRIKGTRQGETLCTPNRRKTSRSREIWANTQNSYSKHFSVVEAFVKANEKLKWNVLQLFAKTFCRALESWWEKIGTKWSWVSFKFMRARMLERWLFFCCFCKSTERIRSCCKTHSTWRSSGCSPRIGSEFRRTKCVNKKFNHKIQLKS